MRDTSELLREVLERADIKRKSRSIWKRMMVDAAAAAICLCLLVAVILLLPGVTGAAAENAGVRYGSLLLISSGLGYVLVGLLSFGIGVFLTLLCLHARKKSELEKKR